MADRGLLAWIGSFKELSQPASLHDLANGAVLSHLFRLIVGPTWSVNVPTPPAGGAASADYMHSLLAAVERYYQTMLPVRDRFDLIDANGLAAGTTKDIVLFLEMLLGIAIRCDQRNSHIQKIMQLPAAAQHQLMVLIEDLMKRQQAGPAAPAKPAAVARPPPADQHTAAGVAAPATASATAAAGGGAELAGLRAELTEARTRITALQQELAASQAEAAGAGGSKAALQAAVRELEQQRRADQSRLAAMGEQIAKLEAAEAPRPPPDLFASSAGMASLQAALAEERDAKESALGQLRRALEERAAAAAEARAARDELDIAKDRLANADAAEKRAAALKKKLEEAGEARDKARALEEQLAAAQRRVEELEEQAGKGALLRGQLEQHKTKLAEHVAQILKLELDVQKKEAELQRREGEAQRRESDHAAALRQLQTDLALAKEQAHAAPASEEVSTSAPLWPPYTAELQEEHARLQEENVRLRKAAAAAAQAGANDAALAAMEARAEDAERTVAALKAQLHSQVQQVEDLTVRAKDYESSAALANGANEKLQQRVRALEAENRQHLQDLNAMIKQHEATAAARQVEAPGAAEERRDMAARLRAAEEAATAAVQEKTRLEGYLKAAKQMIKDLREKEAELLAKGKEAHAEDVTRVQSEHADLITALQQQIRDKERHLQGLKNMFEEGRVAAAREQQLVTSAFYEMGLEVARAHARLNPLLPSAHLLPPQEQPLDAATFLQRKRAQARAGLPTAAMATPKKP